jgi:hypothetical protein
MAIRAKGVSEIKTLAAVRGGGVHSEERHVKQFQIACLELERARRARERQAALGRIAHLDCRLGEIASLIADYQEALRSTPAGAGGARPATARTAGTNERRRTVRY